MNLMNLFLSFLLALNPANAGRVVIVQSSAVTPSSFATLQLWLEPTDNATITTSGGKATAWADKSAVGNNASQGNATYQFTPTASAINGKQAMLAPTINTFTANTGMAVTLTNGPLSAFSFGILAQPGSGTPVFTALVGSETNTGDITIETNGSDATKIDGYVQNVGATGASATGAFNTGTTYWIFCTYSTPTLSCWANNTSILTTTTNLTSRQLAQAISIGGNTGVGGFKPFRGYIGDVVVYSSALNSTDRSSLYTNYIKPKWGL